jgi:hypothetical protein
MRFLLGLPLVSCIVLLFAEQERYVWRGAGKPGSPRLQLPQCAHPRPIGELQAGENEDHRLPDLVDDASQLGDFVARKPPVERQDGR